MKASPSFGGDGAAPHVAMGRAASQPKRFLTVKEQYILKKALLKSSKLICPGES